MPRPPSAVIAPLPAAAIQRHRRSPRWIALGVVAICLGALASYFLYSQAAESHSVVAVRDAVPRGTVIQASDLTVVTVGSTPGIRTVDADQLPGLVGRRTALDLVPGTLLPPDSVAVEPQPSPQRAIVGIRLGDGRAPRGHLESGSPVRLVAVAPANADAGFRDGFSDLSVTGRVVEVTTLNDGQSVLLDVDVPSTQAASVARLAAQDRIVAIRDSEG
ncbi:MAG: SAF domain-containing protein [Propionibacteriaceae bacterium]